MANSVLVAGVVAVLSVGVITLSCEASARSGGVGGAGAGRSGGVGGLGAGRSGGGHVGFQRPAARPFFPGRHVNRPAVRPGGRHIARPGQHHRKVFHHKRGVGLGLPMAAFGIPDGGPYAYPTYGGPVGPDSLVGPDPFISGGASFAPYRHVCRSDVQVVPATAGGEASVTVTSCYVVPN
jgi:hypothetical protein